MCVPASVHFALHLQLILLLQQCDSRATVLEIIVLWQQQCLHLEVFHPGLLRVLNSDCYLWPGPLDYIFIADLRFP